MPETHSSQSSFPLTQRELVGLALPGGARRPAAAPPRRTRSASASAWRWRSASAARRRARAPPRAAASTASAPPVARTHARSGFRAAVVVVADQCRRQRCTPLHHPCATSALTRHLRAGHHSAPPGGVRGGQGTLGMPRPSRLTEPPSPAARPPPARRPRLRP